MPKQDFDYASAWPYTRVNEQGERVPCTAEYNAQLMARLALNPGFSDAIYAIVNVPIDEDTTQPTTSEKAV